MTHRILKSARLKSTAALLASSLVGCGPAFYKPNVTSDTQLSAYAGQANYPRQVAPTLAPHLFSTVGPGPVITLYNAGDEPLAGFELWVNQIYTIHVEKLDAKGLLTFDPKSIFNKTGATIDGVPPSSITTVEIQTAPDKLVTVQGPILPH